MTRLDTLAQRRAALSAEIAEQRVHLADANERIQVPLQRVQRLPGELRELRRRYGFLLLPLAVLALLNPRPTLRLALGAWTLWRSVARPHDPGARPAYLYPDRYLPPR
ncbi:MAG TPA: YqjK family protein [Verrucomicrobiae bacterium]|nr:YqjK family protein [Verrucomicrobiae bacterium]